MPKPDRILPNFDNPPVVEVIAGVQFEPLSLSTAWVGRWWEQIRDRLPHVEDKPPVQNVLEDFGPPRQAQVRLQVLPGAPDLRVWFSNKADGSELLQIQSDRLLFNWRGLEDEHPYPRYEFVRKRFDSYYGEYESFLKSHELGPIEPNQCELTYINHVKVGQGWKDQEDWNQVFKFWKNLMIPGRKLELEQINSRLAYKMMTDTGEPMGRLHVTAEKRHFLKTNEPLLYLELIARGAPLEKSRVGVLRFIDKAHEEIVSSFDAITEAKMHQLWRKSNG